MIGDWAKDESLTWRLEITVLLIEVEPRGNAASVLPSSTSDCLWRLHC